MSLTGDSLSRHPEGAVGVAATRDRSRRCGLGVGRPGTVLGEFRDAWVHVVPRLCAGYPNIGFCDKPTRVIEARGPDAYVFRPGRTTRQQRSTAGRAEFSCCDITAFSHRLMLLTLTTQQPNRLRKHDQRCRIATPTCALTI